MDNNNLEQAFFRGLNALVEPLVRIGIGSPAFTPASLIVLETVNYKSGLKRSTPLMALLFGRYTLVSTARRSSFWVKNLIKEPIVNYYLGGRSRDCRAYVMGEEPQDNTIPATLDKVVEILRDAAPSGWTFVILSPLEKTGTS